MNDLNKSPDNILGKSKRALVEERKSGLENSYISNLATDKTEPLD